MIAQEILPGDYVAIPGLETDTMVVDLCHPTDDEHVFVRGLSKFGTVVTIEIPSDVKVTQLGF